MVRETEIRARYSETDQMGIIYHANYFSWFEIGRTDSLRQMGMSYKDMEEKNILLPVIDVGCKYIIAAKYDDEIIIKTRITQLKGVKIQFNYELYRKNDNILLAEGHTLHAFVDKSLKPINFRKKHKDIWESLNKNLE